MVDKLKSPHMEPLDEEKHKRQTDEHRVISLQEAYQRAGLAPPRPPEEAKPAMHETLPLDTTTEKTRALETTEETGVDPLIGLPVGNYVIEKYVAGGGMGIVYYAQHRSMNRPAAIKVLRPEMADSPEQVARFEREAAVLSSIRHQGVTNIIDWGRLPDGRHYMTMEYLDGNSLEEVLAQEKRNTPGMPVFRVLEIADEILDALQAAHKVNVIHRDLKPSNIYIVKQSDGTECIKLLDFGLAKENPVNALQPSTNAGTEKVGALDKASVVAGTPEYIAPEQAKGLAASTRTDIYSLGVVLFEMLSGDLPFRAANATAMMRAHAYEEAPDISKLVDGLPNSLAELLIAMLKKKPEDRPRNVDDVKQRLRRIMKEIQQEDTVVRAMPLPLPQETKKKIFGPSWWAYIGAPLAISFIMGGVLLYYANEYINESHKNSPPPPQAPPIIKVEAPIESPPPPVVETTPPPVLDLSDAAASPPPEDIPRKKPNPAIPGNTRTASAASATKKPPAATTKYIPSIVPASEAEDTVDCAVAAVSWTAQLTTKLNKYHQSIKGLSRINDENRTTLANEFRGYQNAIQNSSTQVGCQKLNRDLNAWMRGYEVQARKQLLD
ncbi:MAG: protein kinase [Cystobacterineae bacterium]|nr:protein kinase [Cystobacterineae bacterium]